MLRLGDPEPKHPDADKAKRKEGSNIRHIGGFSNRDKPGGKHDPRSGRILAPGTGYETWNVSQPVPDEGDHLEKWQKISGFAGAS
jgi:hypothetical protein